MELRTPSLRPGDDHAVHCSHTRCDPHGFFYWLIWGKGLEYIEHVWTERGNRERDLKGRAAAVERQQLAPIRAIIDARDAASVLMVLVARLRGVLTPEQVAAIEGAMVTVLGLADELRPRFAYARFAAEQAGGENGAVDALAPLLRGSLNPSEKEELFTMLQRIAEVHGGPIDRRSA